MWWLKVGFGVVAALGLLSLGVILLIALMVLARFGGAAAVRKMGLGWALIWTLAVLIGIGSFVQDHNKRMDAAQLAQQTEFVRTTAVSAPSPDASAGAAAGAIR